ncbi:hypothetical protein BD311DRAFT_796071 [Dichomitus squalens]|uniref:Transferrin receptor-like dimerisation domain-containing protein n=1 Tax=Dichomitus squalens TaxID=114155 RepID=A0A4Q9MRA3_9APHY|nr:hypothetical protein BD311DRAFT_796071 [Dichomitus squalens]
MLNSRCLRDLYGYVLAGGGIEATYHNLQALVWLPPNGLLEVPSQSRSMCTIMSTLEPDQYDGPCHENVDWTRDVWHGSTAARSAPKRLRISTCMSYPPRAQRSPGDLHAAKALFEVFQAEFGIPASDELESPYHAGTPESRSATADILNYPSPKAWFDQYFPAMNSPLDQAHSILDEDGAPEGEADFREDKDPRDSDADRHRDAVPAFRGYSADGEAQGQLVVVNYGRNLTLFQQHIGLTDLVDCVVADLAGEQFGLVALRLAESFILPLNTTYYAHRPDKYLDEVDEGLGASADISGLRKSIARLQGASRALDKETAEQHMRELLDKFLHPGRSIHTGIGTDPSTPSINIATARGSTASRFRKSFGGCWTSYLGTEARRGWDPIRKFCKAMERVQTANAKLIAFEHGFISEEGVEDRKWYTHLGVALGKWQGTWMLFPLYWTSSGSAVQVRGYVVSLGISGVRGKHWTQS